MAKMKNTDFNNSWQNNGYLPPEEQWEFARKKFCCLTFWLVFFVVLSVLGITAAILMPILLPTQQVNYELRIIELEEMNIKMNVTLVKLNVTLERLEKTVSECNCKMPRAGTFLQPLQENIYEGSGAFAELAIDDEDFADSAMDCFPLSRPVCPNNCIREITNNKGCKVPVCCI